jgi:hypothetical protein
MDDREQANRRMADYVQTTRRRLVDGKSEIARQQNELGMTQRHIDEMARWLDRSDELRGH